MTPNKFTAGTGMALSTIWSHKLRSLLTVLGVILGVSLIGTGLQQWRTAND
jgi:hypothetical protein